MIDLIFLPGFSTARDITDVSGRGVGMGAVRTAVERLRGRVLVETRLGKGSMVRFILPFSVMMTRVLTVEIGQQIFGIPLDAVVETVCIRREQIHPIGSGHAFVLRNLTIPLIELGRTLGRGGEHASADATIVVVASGDQLGGASGRSARHDHGRDAQASGRVAVRHAWDRGHGDARRRERPFGP